MGTEGMRREHFRWELGEDQSLAGPGIRVGGTRCQVYSGKGYQDWQP